MRDFSKAHAPGWSLGELWIFRVWPATFKYRQAEGSETTKTPFTLQARSFFSSPFLEFCLTTTAFSSIVLFHMFCSSIGHIKNSRESLWNLRYSEKGDLSEHFARTYSLVMQFSHESEHTKLMTSLIINLELAVFYRQSLSCEVIDKSQGDLNSSSSKYFPLCPL